MPDANEGPTALPRLGRHLVVFLDRYRQESPIGGRRRRVPFAASCGGAREVAFAVPLVAINGIRLMVEARGSGEPLVLVHGSWDNRRAWAFVDEQLARSFRVVSYDRRGHSDSEDGPMPGSRREDEDDLAALIESVALAPVHLVGNSFGASIALGLAARRRELVRSLCVHEPPLLALVGEDPSAGLAGALVGEVLSLIERGEHAAGARLFVEQGSRGPGAWAQMPPEERAAMTDNAPTFVGEQRDPAWANADLDRLARLSRPVLLTQGDQSPPFFATIIASLASAIHHAEVRTLSGAGHVPHVTHPSEWVTLVRTFTTALD